MTIFLLFPLLPKCPRLLFFGLLWDIVKFSYDKYRVEICRDRQSRKFSWRRNGFRKQSRILCTYLLSNLCTFCVISFSDGVNLNTFCEKQEHFIGLIPFQTNYTLLLQFSKCRDSCIFLPQKLWSHNFLTNFMSG